MRSLTMEIMINNNVTYLSFNIFKKYPTLVAAHSTRIGGVSQGVFTSMNLGFSRGDEAENVLENYKRFSKAIGVDYNKMVLSDQWHHTNILSVKESHMGMGIIKKRTYSDIDGLVTNVKGLPLVTFYADCVPIYFFDPNKEVIGMVHAGWRGTVAGISKKMIDVFKDEYQSNLDDLIVAIGPSICKSCYEVGQEVVTGLKQLPIRLDGLYTYNKDLDKYYIDLWEINKSILIKLGLDADNISVSDLCTKCNEDLFFSHRQHGNDRGSQIGVMMLK